MKEQMRISQLEASWLCDVNLERLELLSETSVSEQLVASFFRVVVLDAIDITITVVWGLTLYSLTIIYESFEGAHCFHLQGTSCIIFEFPISVSRLTTSVV
jgi:hypothetical protein